MKASHGTEPRVIRLADAPDAIELDTTDLLGRLEAQAEENGRLAEKVESLEQLARSERDARRRVTETLKRERKAAALLAQQRQTILMQLDEAQRRLAILSRPMWRKLLRQPPKV
jgi:hypothetical protein